MDGSLVAEETSTASTNYSKDSGLNFDIVTQTILHPSPQQTRSMQGGELMDGNLINGETSKVPTNYSKDSRLAFDTIFTARLGEIVVDSLNPAQNMLNLINELGDQKWFQRHKLAPMRSKQKIMSLFQPSSSQIR